jgi:hypothetical protein
MPHQPLNVDDDTMANTDSRESESNVECEKNFKEHLNQLILFNVPLIL